MKVSYIIILIIIINIFNDNLFFKDATIIDKKKEGMNLAEIAELLRRSYSSLRTRWNKVLKPKIC